MLNQSDHILCLKTHSQLQNPQIAAANTGTTFNNPDPACDGNQINAF